MSGQIYELLPKVMKAVGPITKDQQMDAPGKKYKFRGVDQVLGKLQPALLQFGCMCSCKTLSHKVEHWMSEDKKEKFHATVTLELTFFAPDGSSIVNSAAGEALDTNGDKATSKAMAQAFKYAGFFGLVLPVDRRLIADSDSGTNTNGTSKPSPLTMAKLAIESAKDNETLDRYMQAAKQKFNDGDYADLARIANERLNELAEPVS